MCNGLMIIKHMKRLLNILHTINVLYLQYNNNISYEIFVCFLFRFLVYNINILFPHIGFHNNTQNMLCYRRTSNIHNDVYEHFEEV